MKISEDSQILIILAVVFTIWFIPMAFILKKDTARAVESCTYGTNFTKQTCEHEASL